MNFGTKKNHRVLFLNSSFDKKIADDETISLIISPEFYWVRVFEIPAKTVKEATKLLPALFEEVVEAKEFSYYCIKLENNKFLCFAYENDKILNVIKDKQLNTSAIKSVHLAQFEFEEYKEYILQSTDAHFSYINDIFVKLPFVPKDQKAIEIERIVDQIKLTKHRLNFQFYKSFLNKKTIITLSILFIAVTLINTARYIFIDNTTSKIDANMQQLQDRYNLPRSKYQLNAMMQSLEKTHTTQTKLKESVDYLLHVKDIDKKTILKSFSIDKNKITLKVTNTTQNALKRFIDAKYKDAAITTSKQILKVEMTNE